MDLANDFADATKTITATPINHFDEVITVSKIYENGRCLHQIYCRRDGDVLYIAAEKYSVEDLRDVVNSINMFKQTNTQILM